MTVDVFVPNQDQHFEEVVALDVDTVEGRYGVLEHHIDTAMALDLGLLYLRYVDGREEFVGLDGGVLVKIGSEVRISTRRVVSGEKLGRIEETLRDREARQQRREEQQLRALARMELQLARSITGAGQEGP